MYREILFTTKDAGEFISGVILFDETIRQKTRDGRSFVEVLEQQGIVPGIKVDKGAKAMANFPGEKITEGLDGLRERLTEYRKLGARFAKWRAVITIGDGIPTRTCIDSNAEALARYAALCQEGDLVPIVEPEVDIHCPEKARAEALLKAAILQELDALPPGDLVMLKLTLPEEDNLYAECVAHPKVVRVVALSGGYTRAEANARLRRNHGIVASFSRALVEGLSAGQSDAEYNALLDASIESIFQASNT